MTECILMNNNKSKSFQLVRLYYLQNNQTSLECIQSGYYVRPTSATKLSCSGFMTGLCEILTFFHHRNRRDEYMYQYADTKLYLIV